MKMNSEVKKNLTAENILLIHGNLASINWWKPACDIWENTRSEDSQGHILMADWRGSGQTPLPQDGEFTIDAVADDYIHFLKENNVSKTNVIGHSTGGIIALAAMAKAPELFNKAIFLDSVGMKGVTFGPEMNDAFTAMKADKNLTAQVIGGTIYKNDFSNDFFNQVIAEDAYTAVNNLGLKVLQSLKGIDFTDQAKSIQQQCLVIHGDKDETLPVEDSKELAKTLPRAEFKILKDQGHCPNYENPELFVQIANDFFGN